MVKCKPSHTWIETFHRALWLALPVAMVLAPLTGCSERDEYKATLPAKEANAIDGSHQPTAGDNLVFGPGGATGGPSTVGGVLSADTASPKLDSAQARLGLTWSEYVGRINAFFALNEMKKQYLQYGLEPPQLAATLRDLQNHCAKFRTSDVSSNLIRSIMDTLSGVLAEDKGRSLEASGTSRHGARISLSDGSLSGGSDWRAPYERSADRNNDRYMPPSSFGTQPEPRYGVTPDHKRDLIRRARQDIDQLATMLGADQIEGDFPGSANTPSRVPVTVPNAFTREPPLKLR